MADAALAINSAENYEATHYLTLQLALRKVVGGAEIDDLLKTGAALGPRVLELTTARAAEIGLALERARGETAALRNLANAARLVDGNPALLQLRVLQELGGSSGNTIVLGIPPSVVPLSVDPAERPS